MLNHDTPATKSDCSQPLTPPALNHDIPATKSERNEWRKDLVSIILILILYILIVLGFLLREMQIRSTICRRCLSVLVLLHSQPGAESAAAAVTFQSSPTRRPPLPPDTLIGKHSSPVTLLPVITNSQLSYPAHLALPAVSTATQCSGT